MAATSTNKQPLLVDRVLHYVYSTDQAINNGIDIVGANTAQLVVSTSGTDGAIIEDVYVISRSTDAHSINFYLSSASDYLRPGEGYFIGQVAASTGAAGDIVRWEEMPRILAPVPQVADVPTGHAAYDTAGGTPATTAPVQASGRPVQFRALYLPKGQNLWIARQSENNATDAPLVGCQGGWY